MQNGRADDERVSHYRKMAFFAKLIEPGADPQAQGFHAAALALISSTLMSGPVLETHPYLVAQAAGLHILKKRDEATSVEARRQFLRAVDAGDLPAPPPAVLTEIRARDP